MFTLRRLPAQGGGTCPLYVNKNIGNFRLLTVLLFCSWITSSTGVLLNYV